MMAFGWVISAAVNAKLGCALPQPFWKSFRNASNNDAAPTVCQRQFGQAVGSGTRSLAPGTELKVVTVIWPPKYGWLSGPQAVVRSAERLLLPTCMQSTSSPGGTKKKGLMAC